MAEELQSESGAEFDAEAQQEKAAAELQGEASAQQVDDASKWEGSRVVGLDPSATDELAKARAANAARDNEIREARGTVFRAEEGSESQAA